MKKLVLLLVLVSSSFATLAQDELTINGRVLDATSQEPLPGANVYALSDWRNGSSTNEQGAFSLTVAANDSLMITFVGYQEQVVPVNPANLVLVVEMVAFAQDMETVTVRASSLVAEEFSIKKIEQLEIYTNPNAKADPLLAVNSLPAATTLDESANISLRGSSPAQTGIFLNDVPIYDAVRFAQLNGIGTFSIFNASLIRQLQVFPSNPPLEFGNTSAGLISLQTVDRLPERATGSLSLSPANLGAYATLRVGKKVGLSLFSNYQPSGLLKVINDRALEDLKRFQTLDFGTHYVHALSERSTLKVFNYAVSEQYRFASRHPSGEGTFRQRKQRNFTVANFRTQYAHATLALNGGFSASRMRFAVGNLDVNLRNRDLYLSANYT
ncbi:MAG: TonB-dependent receptor, partial [Tunicatimonas sp.]